VVKNKIAPPFKQAEFDIIYGQGISREGSVLDLAVAYGILQKSGSWYVYGEKRMGQGRDQARGYLIEHPKVANELEQKIREKAGLLEGASKGTGK
jgi:recombination protein RecA